MEELVKLSHSSLCSMCVHAYKRMYVCLWRYMLTLGYFPQSHPQLTGDRVSHWTWSSLFWLDCPVSPAPGICLSLPLQYWLICTHCCTQLLHGCRGSELRSSLHHQSQFLSPCLCFTFKMICSFFQTLWRKISNVKIQQWFLHVCFIYLFFAITNIVKQFSQIPEKLTRNIASLGFLVIHRSFILNTCSK